MREFVFFCFLRVDTVEYKHKNTTDRRCFDEFFLEKPVTGFCTPACQVWFLSMDHEILMWAFVHSSFLWKQTEQMVMNPD